jgi:hypothetical protein
MVAAFAEIARVTDSEIDRAKVLGVGGVMDRSE